MDISIWQILFTKDSHSNIPHSTCSASNRMSVKVTQGVGFCDCFAQKIQQNWHYKIPRLVSPYRLCSFHLACETHTWRFQLPSKQLNYPMWSCCEGSQVRPYRDIIQQSSDSTWTERNAQSAFHCSSSNPHPIGPTWETLSQKHSTEPFPNSDPKKPWHKII